MKTLFRFLTLAAAAAASAPALATEANVVSEPGMLGLLAAGVVAGVVAWARNRRK